MASLKRILTIDGGGVRGIIPAMVLAEIERRTKKPISELFDFIAGTSTGGILALALCKPKELPTDSPVGAWELVPAYSAEDLVSFYARECPKIFGSTAKAYLGDLYGPKYSEKPLEESLEKFFGGTLLSEAITDVLVSSYCIERRRPVFFKSSKAKTNPIRNVPMKVAARATSAAPTFFSPHRLDLNAVSVPYFSLVDGGIFANNPTLCALTEIWKAAPNSDIFVVSLGTGNTTLPYHHNDAVSYGAISWAPKVIDCTFDGTSQAIDHQMSMLMQRAEPRNRNYYRLQIDLPPDMGEMDDATERSIQKLKLKGEELIRKSREQIKEICTQLMP